MITWYAISLHYISLIAATVFVLSIIIIIINFFCIKEWKNNTNNNFVKVNKITTQELKFIMFLCGACLIIYSFILFSIKSQYAFLNAVTTITFLLSNYFSYRRSIFQFYSLITYEVAYISLWYFSALNGEISSVVLLIGGVLELIYNIMGIIKWKKISTLQNSIKCKTLYFLK